MCGCSRAVTVVGRLGRKGANGGWLDCAMRQNWNGGLGDWGIGGLGDWGIGGKGLMAMNRLVIGLYRL
ncbi:hypothetical protein [Bartonella sp. CL434QHHD]|uniref:hypothetical protein n=1 Tax=Bartonella sp. CL434QHHD TaxID=3243529 RepID=UPI0035CFAEFA